MQTHYTFTEEQLLEVLALAHSKGFNEGSILNDSLSNHDVLGYLQRVGYRGTVSVSNTDEVDVTSEPTMKIQAVSRKR